MTLRPTRRAVLGGTLAALAAPMIPRRLLAAPQGPALVLPPLRDATGSAIELTARAGLAPLGGGAPVPTKGWDGAHLGPTLRMRRGSEVAVTARNETEAPVSLHWHGLNVPSDVDGGAPQSAFPPGATRRLVLRPDQPAATLWYHTHVHGRAAPDVAAGLAGALILEDEGSDELGLPTTYGRDDLVLILQDKRLTEGGGLVYAPTMMDLTHGFVGDVVLANGQRGPVAEVPRGVIRLRLVNAATAAIFRLALSDGRPLHLLGVDQGLLPRPVETTSVRLAPGERLELAVDMAEGGEARLLASIDPASGMMGMMGGMSGMMGMDGMDHGGMGGMTGTAKGMGRGAAGGQVILALRAGGAPSGTGALPSRLAPDPEPDPAPEATRRFAFSEGMEAAMGGMDHGAMAAGAMTVNGRAYDPDRIDFVTRPGAVERWVVEAADMAHPFHAHGVKFLIEEPRAPEEHGWKDVALVEGERALLVSVEAPSRGDVPFMLHCHILEHEDAGMMAQFLAPPATAG